MEESFWSRLARSLAYIRKRNTVLNAVAILLVAASLLMVLVARSIANHTGEIPWGIYLGVAGCVGTLILLNVIFERDWF